MRLEPLLQNELTMVLPGPASRDALLEQISKRMAEVLEGVDAEALQSALATREQQGPTSTPEGVAFPHAMVEGMDETVVAVAVLEKGVPFGHADHPPSDVIFVIAGSQASAWEHVSVLARLARICHTPGALRSFRDCRDGEQLYEVLRAEDARHG
jgi:PTS system nitrogen regulatory IIA component